MLFSSTSMRCTLISPDIHRPLCIFGDSSSDCTWHLQMLQMSIAFSCYAHFIAVFNTVFYVFPCIMFFFIFLCSTVFVISPCITDLFKTRSSLLLGKKLSSIPSSSSSSKARASSLVKRDFEDCSAILFLLFVWLLKELVTVTIYCCMCRGSLPVGEGESVQISTDYNGWLRPSSMTKTQEKHTEQGPTTVVCLWRKEVCSKVCSKRKWLINSANFYWPILKIKGGFTRHSCLNEQYNVIVWGPGCLDG